MRPGLRILFTSGSGISVVEAMLASWQWQDNLVPKPYRTGALVEAVERVLANNPS
jgi:hypothetical protein